MIPIGGFAATDTAPQEFTVTIQNVPGLPPPAPPGLPWLGFALGGLALVVAAVVARRRAARPAPPPRRWTRILRTALTGAGALTLMLAPDFEPGGGPFARAPPLALALAPVVLVHFAGLAMLAALLFGTADLLLDAFSPRRTRLWLALAPPLLAAFVLATLAGTGWLDPMSFAPDPAPLLLVLAALAAGLTWWSDLPAPDRDEARIVD